MQDQNRRPRINLTKLIPKPSVYILALDNQYKDFAFNEERAPLNKGQWRQQIFHVDESVPIDLEVGTGNGNHFAHHALTHPNRCLVGFELKYKPLIQTIRRALNGGAKNAAICRFHAHNVDEVFAEQEINNVYVHFPDPWERPRKFKNRIVCQDFLNRLHPLQKPGSFFEFKTDSREYFLWAREELLKTKYKIVEESLDLHNSPYAENNYMTTFERIFISQKIPINYLKATT